MWWSACLSGTEIYLLRRTNLIVMAASSFNSAPARSFLPFCSSSVRVRTSADGCTKGARHAPTPLISNLSTGRSFPGLWRKGRPAGRVSELRLPSMGTRSSGQLTFCVDWPPDATQARAPTDADLLHTYEYMLKLRRRRRFCLTMMTRDEDRDRAVRSRF